MIPWLCFSTRNVSSPFGRVFSLLHLNHVRSSTSLMELAPSTKIERISSICAITKRTSGYLLNGTFLPLPMGKEPAMELEGQ